MTNMSFSILFFSTLVATFVCYVSGTVECESPSGGTGECVPLDECNVLQELVQKFNKTPEDLELLMNSKCGERSSVSVCCPLKCTTPDGNEGKCVDINSCTHLAIMEDKQNVKQLKCRGPDSEMVCCGPAPKNSHIASININAICSAQVTAHPPDPTSKCCGYESRSSNKIWGGNATDIDQYPWMVVLEYDKKTGHNLLCGGSLISGKYVLTAAHCFIRKYKPKLVRLGEYDTNNDGPDCKPAEAGGEECTDGVIKINIEKYIIHPDYSVANKRSDVALIRLEKMAPFNYFIRPICLPTYDITDDPPQNLMLYVAGWGIIEDETYSNIKMHVDLPYVSWEQCQPSYARENFRIKLWNRQLCAGGQPGKDSCLGDSGGPLMHEDGSIFQLHGVVSFGPKPCAQGNIPGVYAKVFAFKEWILSNIID